MRSVGAVGLAIAMSMSMVVAGCSSSGDQAAESTPSSSATSPSPSPAVSSPPPALPPFVDHVAWVQTSVGPSLQVFPTPSGRRAPTTDADAAWSEVVADARAQHTDAYTAGMRAQFDCHWQYARVFAPDKTSWNLEPDRPVVTPQQMFAANCNPGGPEE
ncbi:DUF2599 domain-containing protein [Williamsia sterculiae]|uniref:DUF2599 domain-containing protein n=1 Tax=Williamsia sterculiae TaxID=1344003 RepID=A0A1N7CUH2_9NOCA|nr:DUF2599 domain-containing protein [Williamsia sterculiae]SIR67190.1 Protein of unknown function [Williamsia sterculiae]